MSTDFSASCFLYLLNWVNSTSTYPRSAVKAHSLKFVQYFEILDGRCYTSAETYHLIDTNGNLLTASTAFSRGVTEGYQMLQAQIKTSSSK